MSRSVLSRHRFGQMSAFFLPRQDYNAPWHPVVVGNWAEMAVLLPRQDPQGLPSPVAATMISALSFFHCRQTLTDGFISMPAIECVFGSLRAFCIHESSHFALCLDTECVGGRIGSFCVQLIARCARGLAVLSCPRLGLPFDLPFSPSCPVPAAIISGRKRDVPVSVGSGRKRERKMSFRFG